MSVIGDDFHILWEWEVGREDCGDIRKLKVY
jgi:hypothetical protein